MNSVRPLSASCANAPPIAAVRKAAAHRPTDIALPMGPMPRRLPTKICNCRQICFRSLIQIKKPAAAIGLMAFMNAKEQQSLEPGSRSHLVEVIEAADRTIKDYLLRQHLSAWHPISAAPNNHDLELKVLDGGSSVVLPFPCRRTNAGVWINADLDAGIDIEPTKWRPWQSRSAQAGNQSRPSSSE